MPSGSTSLGSENYCPVSAQQSWFPTSSRLDRSPWRARTMPSSALQPHHLPRSVKGNKRRGPFPVTTRVVKEQINLTCQLDSCTSIHQSRAALRKMLFFNYYELRAMWPPTWNFKCLTFTGTKKVWLNCICT